MILVVIFFGNKIPKYVLMNLRYLKINFPKYQLQLITDSQEVCQAAESIGVKVWRTSDVREQVESKLRNSSLDLKFREGFWVYTVGRFFVLKDFMEAHRDRSVLQIEADVLLLPNFPMDKVSTLKASIAFPVSQENLAVPSTIFLRDQESAHDLQEFAEKCMARGEAYDDCRILGLYGERYPDRTYILPSNFKSDCSYNSSVPAKTRRKMCENLDEFNGFFDGSSWGQFISGTDPANAWGVSFRYRNQRHQAINPTKCKISFDPETYIEATCKDEVAKIFSLHVHSKNSRYFQDLEYIDRSINRIERGLFFRSKLYPKVLFKALCNLSDNRGFVTKIVLRIKRKVAGAIFGIYRQKSGQVNPEQIDKDQSLSNSESTPKITHTRKSWKD